MSTKMLEKHFIEFLYPCRNGGFSSETFRVRQRPKEVELPVGAVAFRFFDLYIQKVEAGYIESEPFNVTGWFFEGKKMSLNVALQKYCKK